MNTLDELEAQVVSEMLQLIRDLRKHWTGRPIAWLLERKLMRWVRSSRR